jgi:hypothetical protein
MQFYSCTFLDLFGLNVLLIIPVIFKNVVILLSISFSYCDILGFPW